MPRSVAARLTREKRTVQLMIEMYCKAHHRSKIEMCASCLELALHASTKIDRCQFHEAKPVCADCRIHCYKKDMRDRIRDVMRYSGQRMVLRHPWLAVLHIVDKMVKPTG